MIKHNKDQGLTTLALGVILALFISGCASTTTVDDYRPTSEPIDIGENEKVAILGRRDAGHYETDRDFIECLAGKMGHSDFHVMSEQEFIDALVRIRMDNGLYVLAEGAVDLRESTLFNTAIRMPANLTEGDYRPRFILTRGGRVVAVGTTVVRSLETACRDGQPRPFRGA